MTALMDELERSLADSVKWYWATRSSMEPTCPWDAAWVRADPASRAPLHKAIAMLREFRRLRSDAYVLMGLDRAAAHRVRWRATFGKSRW